MNRKKSLVVLAFLLSFLAAFATALSRYASAQTVAIGSDQHSLQADTSHPVDPAAPAIPLPSPASSSGIQAYPSDDFKLRILVKDRAGGPASGAMLLIAFPNSGEAPSEVYADDRGEAVLMLRDVIRDLPDVHDHTSNGLAFWVSAAWINPRGDTEYLQTSADLMIDRSTPTEFVVAAQLSPVAASAPADVRTNPCYQPGGVNTHLLDVLWGTTDHPERRWEGEMQIGQLNALLPPPNQASFALATNHSLSFETLIQLGVGPIRTSAYDVQGTGTGAEFSTGGLNNGIFDIYAAVEIIPRTRHYRCYAVPPTDPNLFYMPVDREESRINRIMGLTPKKREGNGVLEIQSNYLSFAVVDRDYACSKNYPANFITNMANEIPWQWSYQSNQWYYWQNEANTSLGPISMGVRFKGGSGTTTQVTHRYLFRRSSGPDGPSVWWAYRAEPGQCDLLRASQMMLTNDKALQNMCGLPWNPSRTSSDAPAATGASDGMLSLPAEACSAIAPPTPEPLPYMAPQGTVTPTPPKPILPNTPTRTPTMPPSNNLSAPDIRGGQLPNSTDWELYLNNWNDVMAGGRYVTHLTNPPDWQDPDPNAGCLGGAVVQAEDSQPSTAPQAACWPSSGLLRVACGSWLEARTFDGSGNSSPIGVFNTGACPSVPTHCFGDFVWHDLDRDGLQESGEPGLANVMVRSAREDGGGEWNTTTDANGRYQLCGLRDGEYYLQVYPPENYTFTLSHQGANDTVDSDVDMLGEVILYMAGSDQWHWDAGLSPLPTSTPTHTPTRTATPPHTLTPTATPTRTPTRIFTPTATATIPPLTSVHVDESLGNDGPTCGASAGVTACRSIGYALANRVATGGTVLVAAGIYRERIVLRSGVKVQGAGANVTTLDGEAGGPVITANDSAITASTVLAGFTITGGDAEKGGGLRIVNGAAPVIELNIIQGNRAGRGAGIYTEDSSPTIRSNTLRNNTAAIFGGAIQTMLGAALIQNNLIENNTADWGGGLMVDVSAALVSNNTIRGNTASGGGGILIYNAASGTISNNLIENNHASPTEPMGGGGLNIDVAASSTLTGNIIRNNTGLAGGGINLGASGLGAPSPLTAHGNILCGNEGYQFYNETGYTPDLTGNWWGTNTLAAAQIYGPATHNPVIVLDVSVSPASVTVPGSSTVRASLQGGGYRVPDGTTITWRTTLGTLAPSSSATVNGLAQTSVSSATVGTASVSAVDPCGFTVSTTAAFISPPATATLAPSRTPTAASTPIPTATVTPMTSPAPTTVTFQQGADGYMGTSATYFDGAGSGYNAAAHLRVNNTGSQKALIRFNTASIPSNAAVQAATLSLYWSGNTNGNGLTVAAYRVLAEWVDSQATRTQRKTGVAWNVAGMGSGSDYLTTAAGTALVSGTAGRWVTLNVTDTVRQWVQNPGTNHGLVLAPQAASGSVSAAFCSELRWTPCVNPPRLLVTYTP